MRVEIVMCWSLAKLLTCLTHFSSVTLQRPPFLPALSAIALLVSGALHAEEQIVTVQDVERIEVRGDFRQTNLQKLPGSVVVLGETDIKRQSAQHLDDLLANIANLNASAGASRSRFLQMRGVGERSEFVDTINPSVGILIDGIDYSGLGITGISDIAQLEVFRGPEASRFGANALAGMLNLTSKGPTATAEGKVSATLANYDSRQLAGQFSNSINSKLGYSLALDLTLRDVQAQLKQLGRPWEVAKGFDGACPVAGFVEKSQLQHPQQLEFRLLVNGKLRQNGNTANMIRGINQLISEMSQHFTLLPGDMVLTGTPAGVGPLAAGDELELQLAEHLHITTKVSA